MLAVVAYIKFQAPELKAYSPFIIQTDYKNLEYFITKKQLTERQVRWYEALTPFQFLLVYRPRSKAIILDALSRREQDILGEVDYQLRFCRFLALEYVANQPKTSRETVIVPTLPIATDVELEEPFQNDELNQLQGDTLLKDRLYNLILRLVRNGDRSLLSEVKVKIQARDYSIDEKGRLRHRGRLQVLGYLVSLEAEYKVADIELVVLDTFRTKLIQSVYDSSVYGHLGQDATASILARNFYQLLQLRHVRQFLRNYDYYGRNKVQREYKHGLLRPLPVPDRFFQEISIDFITDLPDAQGNRYLQVIKDWLSKQVVLEAITTIKAEECATKFIDYQVRYYRLLSAITSDRGTNQISTFQTELCRLLSV